jgi:hypothetical protein
MESISIETSLHQLDTRDIFTYNLLPYRWWCFPLLRTRKFDNEKPSLKGKSIYITFLPPAAGIVVVSNTTKGMELGQNIFTVSKYRYIAPTTHDAFTYDITGTFEGGQRTRVQFTSNRTIKCLCRSILTE